MRNSFRQGRIDKHSRQTLLRMKLQVTIGDELETYLELKAQMMGEKTVAAAARAVLTDSMLRDSAAMREYLKLKREIFNAEAKQPDRDVE